MEFQQDLNNSQQNRFNLRALSKIDYKQLDSHVSILTRSKSKTITRQKSSNPNQIIPFGDYQPTVELAKENNKIFQPINNGFSTKKKQLKRLQKTAKAQENLKNQQEQHQVKICDEILSHNQNELQQELRAKNQKKVAKKGNKKSSKTEMIFPEKKEEQRTFQFKQIENTQYLNSNQQNEPLFKQIKHQEVQDILTKSINNSPNIRNNRIKEQIKKVSKQSRSKSKEQTPVKKIELEEIEDNFNDYIDYQIPKKSQKKIRQQRIAMIEELEKKLGLDKIEFDFVVV